MTAGAGAGSDGNRRPAPAGPDKRRRITGGRPVLRYHRSSVGAAAPVL